LGHTRSIVTGFTAQAESFNSSPVATDDGLLDAILALARREAAAAGLANASFAIGDATALPVPRDCFDGAVSRFSLHHIPLPGRLLVELRRAVKPGGRIVIADIVADSDPEAAAWSEEIERLRDPTHWASLNLGQMHTAVERARLTIERESLIALSLDFDDWLARGGTAPADHALVELALNNPPAHAAAFVVTGHGGRRTLHLQMWLARLRS
jgi:SAM-dependent methyltransferase